ncbi:conserved hypothetical protein [Microbacterium sp. 8M]|nr:conserved hypothetical protein [Microbacterium sp. 8M]
MARGAQRAHPRIRAGAGRQPPARPVRSRGDTAHVGAGDRRGADRAALAPGAAVAHRRRRLGELDRAEPHPGAVLRVHRAVGGAHLRHAAPGAARAHQGLREDRHPARGRAGARPLRQRDRLRREHRRLQPQRDQHAVRIRRAEPAAQRRLLQRAAARRGQRPGARLDALRQHLRRLGQRRDREDDDLRNPARHAARAVRAGTDARPVPRRAAGPRRRDLRLGERHQPAHQRRGDLPHRTVPLSGREEPWIPSRRGSHEGRGRGRAGHQDPVLRVPRHERLREAHRRARRRRHHGEGAAPRGQRAGVGRAGQRRRVGDGVDRAGAAAHERRHRAVVRALALHHERLRPDAPSARAAGCAAEAVHAAERAHALQRDRRGGHLSGRHRPAAGQAARVLRPHDEGEEAEAHHDRPHPRERRGRVRARLEPDPRDGEAGTAPGAHADADELIGGSGPSRHHRSPEPAPPVLGLHHPVPEPLEGPDPGYIRLLSLHHPVPEPVEGPGSGGRRSASAAARATLGTFGAWLCCGWSSIRRTTSWTLIRPTRHVPWSSGSPRPPRPDARSRRSCRREARASSPVRAPCTVWRSLAVSSEPPGSSAWSPVWAEA